MQKPHKVNKKVDSDCLPLEKCLAKTWRDATGEILPGRSVEEHCRIAGAIAMELMDGYFSLLKNILPQDAWLGAQMHDIGKASPIFQKKIYESLGLEKLPACIAGADISLESIYGGHAATSYSALIAMGAQERFADVAGRHHGRNIDKKDDWCEIFGGKVWSGLRSRLGAKLLGDCKLPVLRDASQQEIVTGMTVLSDWIASGEIFDDPSMEWEGLVKAAIAKAGFQIPSIRASLNFEDIFSFPPNEMQTVFASQVKGPGVYVLEAPMGLGKTEAALFAAYKLLASGQATGLYFGLPTQLTSNRIHDRVNNFLDKILAEKRPSMLLHSGAWLKLCLEQEMGRELEPGQAWFDHGKRGLLAPFGTGTIDQALLAIMHVRHAGLRRLGLAGKVVILDEVHSYDEYTGTLLENLVAELRKYGSTIIILSATLTAARRKKLLGYETESSAYPLITRMAGTEKPLETTFSKTESKSVGISLESGDSTAIEKALQAAESGQQVLWIENTVAMARKIYRLLGARAAALNIPSGLLHSRFLPGDREKAEKLWTNLYGKNNRERSACGRILVGTQVLEQSLDLDADFLITRLCPIDMLLQRMGRLWRHDRPDRAPEAVCRTIILSPPLSRVLENPDTALVESGTSKVYAPYILGRTLEAINSKASINLPEDIRGVLESVYEIRDRESTPKMQDFRDKMEKEASRKLGAAFGALSSGGRVLADRLSTRLMEQEQIKVLLLAGYDSTGRCFLADGREIRLTPAPATVNERKKIAAALALNTLMAPARDAPPPPDASKCLKHFAPYIYEARSWDKGHEYAGDLAIAIINPDGTLADVSGNPIPDLHYSPTLGYWKEREI